MLEILPFQDLPIAQEVPEKSEEEIIQEIKVWSENRVSFYAIAFLGLDGDQMEMGDYRYRIGQVVDGHLVASQKRVYELSKDIESIPEEAREPMKEVLSIYIEKMQKIPPWGTLEYFRLLDLGKTPRKLIGPNKKGELRIGECRWVILDSKRNLVYGPFRNPS